MVVLFESRVDFVKNPALKEIKTFPINSVDVELLRAPRSSGFRLVIWILQRNFPDITLKVK